MFQFYKLIVAGGRDFSDYNLLDSKLNSFRWVVIDQNLADDIEVVCGCAKGADSLGEEWALANHVSIKRFPADWDKLGKAAGPIRNKQMGDYADGLLAFWDGKSRGTNHMITYAKEKGLDVLVVNY